MNENYIKKCRKCPDLQDNHKIVMGDKVYDLKTKRIYVALDNYDITGVYWLPTQEQLQQQLRKESLKLSQMKDLQLLSVMRIGIQKCGCNTYLKNCDLNEMWLMYYMWEIHQKLWNDSNNVWEKR